MFRLLAAARGSSGTFTPSLSSWSNATSIAADLEALWPHNEFTVTVDSTAEAFGYKPANGEYNALYTRDHAYVIWHYPTLLTAAERRQFVSYYLERRTDGVISDGGGTLPADFVCDRMDAAGNAVYRNDTSQQWPILDGIHFVILALWSDWNLTGDDTTFLAQQSAIDDCLAAIPRAANGCVHFDDLSIDYGFTDQQAKSGDVAYGTALQAWAYKMCAEMAGESGSGTYTTLRAEAEAGLATLRQPDGWYAGDSELNVSNDDVWATALIVAEELVSGTDRTDSATTIRDAYLAGTITQDGLVRHLVSPQVWGTSNNFAGDFQNGGYWPTPMWDCYRAVNLVDPSTAHAWVQEFLDEIEAEIATYGATLAPIEWKNNDDGQVGEPKGYSAHAALIQRFL